ncbi:pimeloyl-ACP methyl ester carboxylesterase [Saccharothrix ecbatanensis]|uniref:Pimeloyl-ACP methyl ester carboxylesterase n=1 Tax=Saccharothrix ecbatanensis TaxID=1105145 RepID=A0A7W9M029_9PSEU|nr:alpha/beta hydrolase [Saccharothrix ecbatanensis]MBB5802529.1 pimeloyl-ACP methyl ester carboxylesterase [Saccharothrix ecbatanensis]
MTAFTFEHITGKESRPAVVFMSALFAGGWIWDDPVRRLTAAGWPVLRTVEPICAVDSRIAGSIERLGDELLAACDEAGVDEIVVCANSLGGLVAIDLAGRFPQRVRGIGVSGAPGLTPDPNVGLNVDSRASVQPSGPEFEDIMMKALFHGPALFTREQLTETADLLRQGPAMLSMARSIRATRTYQVEPALDRITCPSLYVWGRHDRMTPIDPWETVIPGRADTEFVAVEDCGHIPMIEAPEEYSDRLLGFLDRVAGAPV